MGNRLSIETYSVKSNRENEEYRISIDSIGSRKHSHVIVFKGMTFRKGVYPDDVGLAKFCLKSPCREWAETQVRISAEASRIAEKFNAVLADAGKRSGRLRYGAVHFSEILSARVDEAAYLFARNIKRGRCYTYEPKIVGFKHFIDAQGELKDLPRSRLFRRSSYKKKRSVSVSSAVLRNPAIELIQHQDVLDIQPCINPPPYISAEPPSYEQSEAEARLRHSTCDESELLRQLILYPDVSRPFPQTSSPRLWASAPAMETPTTELRSPAWGADTDGQANILEAFVHYFYTHTGGQCAVSSLKGSVDKEGRYTLTTPVFHTLSRAYGDLDQGEQGIATVIQNHRCNHLCRPMRDMKMLYEEAKVKRDVNIYETRIINR